LRIMDLARCRIRRRTDMDLASDGASVFAKYVGELTSTTERKF
jgi:hypothetical protein